MYPSICSVYVCEHDFGGFVFVIVVVANFYPNTWNNKFSANHHIYFTVAHFQSLFFCFVVWVRHWSGSILRIINIRARMYVCVCVFIFINPSTVVRSAAILYIFDKAFQPYLCAILFFFVSFLSTSALDIDLFWHCLFFRVSLMFYAHFKTYLSQCDSFWLLLQR